MINDTGETGVIVDIQGNIASVKLAKSESCDQCSSREFCQPDDSNSPKIFAQNSVNAKIGQLVNVKEDSKFLLLLSFMQYGLPLAGLLTGIFIIDTIKPTIGAIPLELLMFATGIVGMFFGGFITWLWAKSKSNSASPCFEIISVIPTERSLH